MKELNGFTLIELIITIALIAILFGIAVPSFVGMIQLNRDVAQVNSLQGNLRWARTEAIKQHVSVSTCASSDKLTCSGSTDWAAGWIIFTDQNNNGVVNDNGDLNLCEDGEDCILKVGSAAYNAAIVSTATITFDAKGTAADNYAITFTPDDCPTGEQNRSSTISILALGKIKKIRRNCP
ncbi:MAG: hypothetical protein DRQ43_00005 [Gammaproteobacteria bacterium]|nr:MAG: hypothetical protein DRQ43_00005 [Gammaproteobacteria bacterium]